MFLLSFFSLFHAAINCRCNRFKLIFIHRLLPSSFVWFCFVIYFLREKCPISCHFKQVVSFFWFNWERKRMVNLFQNITIVLNSVKSSVSIFNVDLSHLYIQSNPYNSDFEWYNSIFSFYRRRWTRKKTHTTTTIEFIINDSNKSDGIDFFTAWNIYNIYSKQRLKSGWQNIH